MSAAPHDSSAAQLVLSLPELLTMILDAKRSTGDEPWNSFQRILSDNDLRKVIRVNRFWFEIGSLKLWASPECIRRLLKVRPARRQLYASKMTQITSFRERLELFLHGYRDVVFERLNKVAIHLNRVCTMEHVEPFLGPSLRSFDLEDYKDLQPEVFSLLERACPDLRDITISAYRASLGPTLESFSRFVQHALFLKGVTVNIQMTSAASSEILSSLAHSSRLERLQLSWVWTESHSQQAAAAVSRSGIVPFPKIIDMNLLIQSKAIGHLVPLIANLQHLGLKVNDSTEDVLPHVSSLGNLKGLIIHYQVPCSIPRQSLLGLGALSRLSTLTICSCTRIRTRTGVSANVTRSTCKFSDDDCEALARRLPNLCALRLQLWCDISTKAVESFLRHCPKLEDCEITQRLDNTDLFTSTSDDMVFPQLRKLCLGSLRGEAIMRSV